MLNWSYVIFFVKAPLVTVEKNLFKCLFDCFCFNPIREYFPHVETSTLPGLTLHLRPLSRKGSLSCHTCCVSSNRPPNCIDMNVSRFLLDLSKRVYESRWNFLLQRKWTQKTDSKHSMFKCLVNNYICSKSIINKSEGPRFRTIVNTYFLKQTWTLSF